MEYMSDTGTSPTGATASLADLRNLLAEEPELDEVSPQEAAAVTDETVVCWCNNVTAGEIRTPLHDGTACDLESVQRCTRATGGCGKCLPMVAAIVNVELSRKENASPR